MRFEPQGAAFLYSLLLGAVIGIIYDIFRIIRMIFNNGKILVFFEDIVFFCIVIVLSTSFIMIAGDGALRGIYLIGELCGAVLYFCTISVFVLKLIKKIIVKIKKIILKITEPVKIKLRKIIVNIKQKNSKPKVKK